MNLPIYDLLSFFWPIKKLANKKKKKLLSCEALSIFFPGAGRNFLISIFVGRIYLQNCKLIVVSIKIKSIKINALFCKTLHFPSSVIKGLSGKGFKKSASCCFLVKFHFSRQRRPHKSSVRPRVLFPISVYNFHFYPN